MVMLGTRIFNKRQVMWMIDAGNFRIFAIHQLGCGFQPLLFLSDLGSRVRVQGLLQFAVALDVRILSSLLDQVWDITHTQRDSDIVVAASITQKNQKIAA